MMTGKKYRAEENQNVSRDSVLCVSAGGSDDVGIFTVVTFVSEKVALMRYKALVERV